MRVVQPLEHLGADEGGVLRRQHRHAQGAGALDHLRQGVPVDQLHGQEVVAVDGPEVEDLGDVAVAEAHHDAGLVGEHADEGLVLCVVREDALDHHLLGDARGRLVASAEDLRHAAGRDAVEQLVLPEPGGLW